MTLDEKIAAAVRLGALVGTLDAWYDNATYQYECEGASYIPFHVTDGKEKDTTVFCAEYCGMFGDEPTDRRAKEVTITDEEASRTVVAAKLVDVDKSIWKITHLGTFEKGEQHD